MKGLAFNQYSWLTTHNSYALSGEKSATGSILISPTNQEDTVTSQLNVSFSTIFSFLGFPLRFRVNIFAACERFFSNSQHRVYLVLFSRIDF